MVDICRNLTSSVYDRSDLQLEINAVNTQHLGDTILLWEGDSGSGGSDSGAGSKRRRRLVGLAVCHCGAATEAGSGTCYLKFGSVLPGSNAAIYFDKLLSACEIFAKA